MIESTFRIKKNGAVRRDRKILERTDRPCPACQQLLNIAPWNTTVDIVFCDNSDCPAYRNPAGYRKKGNKEIYYDADRWGRQCNRCNWEWRLKTDIEPKNCPHCKSPYWNKPRRGAQEL